MKNKLILSMERLLLLLVFTVALLSIGVFVVIFHESDKDLLYFQIQDDAGAIDIRLYEAEGCYYVFLPSFCSMNEVTVVSDKIITIGDISLANGMDCSCFQTNTAYQLSIGNSEPMQLQFLQSSNVATIYINTASQNMNYIHQSKGNSEISSIMLYTADGKLDYSNNSCTLKGRGQATWAYPKKPYTLSLPSETALLGMPQSSEWTLLANATDQTNLRNKLVYQFAAEGGMAWVPSCEYVDVYLNGVYNGLYVLAEKVDAAAEPLGLEPETGDFLCKIDLEERWDQLSNPIKTSLNRTIEICNPVHVNRTQRTYYINKINELEHILSTLQDLDKCEQFDLDSWVRRYLIDTIFCNIDSDLASSYFYYCDGIFYAGPVWDYDMTMGNSWRCSNPKAFYAEETYYSFLYSNKSFFKRIVDIYQSEYLPKLMLLVEEKVPSMASLIADASHMNDVRWNDMFVSEYESGMVYKLSADELATYLRERIDFLNSAWIDGITYRTIRLDIISQGVSYTFSVKDREILDLSGTELTDMTWIDTKTNEVFDTNSPITENMVLKAAESQVAQPTLPPETPIATQEVVTIFTCLILLSLFLALAAIDIVRRKKERGRWHAVSRSEVSS